MSSLPRPSSGSPFRDDMMLAEARDVLGKLVLKGHKCPCCDQFAKVYRRRFPAACARTMILLHRAGPGMNGYHELSPLVLPHGLSGGYTTLGRHWGVMERMPGVRGDGSDQVGWWRLTALGEAFVQKRTTIPEYALIYNDRCLRLDGDMVDVGYALGKEFDYADLMNGEVRTGCPKQRLPSALGDGT